MWGAMIAIVSASVAVLLLILTLSYFMRKSKYTEDLVTKEEIIHDRDFRVVFSITTIPSRAHRVHEVIRNLLLSSIEPDAVYLNLPNKSARFPEEYVVSKELKQVMDKYGNFILNRCDDYGPATKLIPTLLLENEDSTIIITADDDIEYPPTYHEELLRQTLKDSKSAYGYRGVRFSVDGSPNYIAGEVGEVDVIEGFTGVVYRRSFFDLRITEVEPSHPCFCTDDIWISNHLKNNNIKRLILPNEPHNVGMGRKGLPITQKRDLSETDPLHVQNHRKRNRECFNYLRQQNTK
jgi:hypothetical protein